MELWEADDCSGLGGWPPGGEVVDADDGRPCWAEGVNMTSGEGGEGREADEREDEGRTSQAAS